MNNLIELEDVNLIRNGKALLKEINWQVKENECWAILGLNSSFISSSFSSSVALNLSKISSGMKPSLSKSWTNFGPSATNKPVFSLPFFVLRERISFILFFEITSQIYKKLSTRHV